jgi:hypothetical protein
MICPWLVKGCRRNRRRPCSFEARSPRKGPCTLQPSRNAACVGSNLYAVLRTDRDEVQIPQQLALRLVGRPSVRRRVDRVGETRPLAPPWARDADGRDLPTRFEIDGMTGHPSRRTSRRYVRAVSHMRPKIPATVLCDADQISSVFRTDIARGRGGSRAASEAHRHRTLRPFMTDTPRSAAPLRRP